MNSEILYLINSSFRLVILSVTSMGVQFYVMNTILHRRHSLCALGMILIEKVILQIVVIHSVITYYYSGEEWLVILNSVVMWTHAILSYVAFCWTFDDDFLKIAAVSVLAEIPPGFFSIISIACVNILEGREDIWELTDVFRLPDLLFPVVVVFMTVLFCRILRPYLKKIREYKIIHRKIGWSIFVIYVIVASLSNYSSWKTLKKVNYIMILYYCLTIAVAVVFIRRYNRNVKREKEFLDTSQGLLETQYHIVQDQIREMENSQHIIDKQMEEITKLDKIEEKTIAEYLKQLKNNYEGIRAGIFCNDWMVDALLCSQERLFFQKGMCLDCHMQGYERGIIEEQDIVQILTLLLEYAAKIGEPDDKNDGSKNDGSKNEVFLQAARIRNQLVIEMSTMMYSSRKFPEKKIRPFIRKYEGDMMKLGDKEKFHIVLTLKIQKITK
ncbi:MAG: hypothetical protein ACI4S2_08755 [Lachnospiraceae bacterium]